MKLLRVLLAILSIAANLSCSRDKQPSTSPSHETVVITATDPRLSALLDILGDSTADGQDKMDAIAGLGDLGDKDAVEPLLKVLEKDMEERTGLWANAIPVLGMLADSRAVPALIEALNNREEDWLGRTMAADALGRIGDPSAVVSLIAAAHYADTRESAINALALIGDVRAVNVLIGALDEAEEPETVQTATQGLIRIGKPAVPAMKKELTNYTKEYPNQSRRAMIEQIVEKINHQNK